MEAAGALGNFGSVASSAVNDLIRLLLDDEADVRDWACTALGRIGPDALPELREATKAIRVRTRVGAVKAMGQMGAAAGAALPAIRRLEQRDISSEVRKAAQDARENIERKKPTVN
jgi:HEAT repeat protein